MVPDTGTLIDTMKSGDHRGNDFGGHAPIKDRSGQKGRTLKSKTRSANQMAATMVAAIEIGK